MAEPVYNITFSATRTGPSVTPTAPQKAGCYGDDKVARITFLLQDPPGEETYRYRIEINDGSGAYDVSELLLAKDHKVSYDIPSSWTAAGIATIRLVEITVGDDGTETELLHYPPCYLIFEDRQDGTQMTENVPVWQKVMSGAETTLCELQTTATELQTTASELQGLAENLETAETRAKEAVAAATTAVEQADSALEKAEAAKIRADSVQGVYVGSGEMPDGYTVQIDPTGEAASLYVVESGKADTVFYRKWSDGTAECWGSVSLQTTGEYNYLLEVALPIVFVTRYSAFISAGNLSANHEMLPYDLAGTGNRLMISGKTTQEVTGSLYFITYGTWKEMA